MPVNNFSDINATASIIAFMAGVWGAVLNFIKRDTKNHTGLKIISFFIMDITVNVGITMLVYIGAVGYGLNDLLSVAIAGALGHQGTRGMHIMELIIIEKLGAKETYEAVKEHIE